tara:strand:+ start:2436 stop:4241 length:1806 start_codon:yes stop_codon:yes gene_type:complete
MKVNIETLQDLFRIGSDAYAESRQEAEHVWELYHNRQYTDEQLAVLSNRGQPPETFNIVKRFARLLIGHYAQVVNTVKVSPRQQADIPTAALLNDIINYTFEENLFETEGDKIKLDGLLSGLMCSYVDVRDTSKKDQFGRVIRKVVISHVPSSEIILDPMSRQEDYSDARFIHRFKWVPEEELVKLFPKKRSIIEKTLQEYENHLDIEASAFESSYNTRSDGKHTQYNNYLLVHSIMQDQDNKTWSVFWVGDEILSKKEITFKEVKFPYRVHRVHTSHKTEYYGLFREVIATQQAMNQALLKIQLLVNSKSILYETGAMTNVDEFVNSFNRVNGATEVKNLSKIRIESNISQVADLYKIVENGNERVKEVLGVNNSFLGTAYASDSGRKVQLQQQQTILALKFISGRIEQFYRLTAKDVLNLVKQYYTANQVLNITDNDTGQRWAEINRPLMQWDGKRNPDGTPVLNREGLPNMIPVFEEVLDPATGNPVIDEDGNYVFAPVPEMETEIAFTDADVSIDTVIYNDADEDNRLVLESFLAGPVAQMLGGVNPAGLMSIAALAFKGVKTKHSGDISNVLLETAQMLSQQSQQPQITEESSNGQ